MLVRWHGHACVEIQDSKGFRIVFDPHDGVSLGIKKPTVKADLILISHDHFDHNAAHVVAKEDSQTLKMFHGEKTIKDVTVKGLLSYHDKTRGSQRGLNTIYVINVESKKIAHLGDLGDLPGEDILGELRGLDLLITPVGGRYTLEPEESWKLVELVNPLNILPIHYRVKGLQLPIKPVEEFTKLVKGYNIVQLDENSFRLENYTKSVIVPRLL